MRTTHTYSTLEVSDKTFLEIKKKLVLAGYEDQFIGEDGDEKFLIDMSGIVISKKRE